MSVLVSVLAFAGTILVLVGAHEIGHFVAAKLAGVRVLEFAVGFGPRIASRRWRGTVYSLRVIPVGGFVRMAGDVGAPASDEVPKEEWFVHQRPLVRAAIGLAGPFSNVVITLVVTVAVSVGFGSPAFQVLDVMPGYPAEGVLLPGDALLRVDGRPAVSEAAIAEAVAASGGAPVRVDVLRGGEPETLTVDVVYSQEERRYLLGFYHGLVAYTNRVVSVDAGSPLYAVGVRTGDRIVALDGAPVASAAAIALAMQALLPRDGVMLEILRGGEPLTYMVPTTALTIDELFAGAMFETTGVVYHRFGVLHGVGAGFAQFAAYFRMFGEVIGGVIGGSIAAGEAFRGPVGIAQMLGESVERGMLDFLFVFSLLSLSLGLMNLLPFPAFDGSRVAFALYEWVRGKPFPPEREGMIHAIGFVLLFALLILITYKDLANLLR